MNTKALTMSIALAVVAMILNPAVTGIKIPAPFLTGLYYQIWDIPIIVAFLLLGFRYATLSSMLNGFFLFAVFPGPSQWLYAPGNVAAQLSMMMGIWLARRLLIKPNITQNNVIAKPNPKAKSSPLQPCCDPNSYSHYASSDVFDSSIWILSPDLYVFAILPIQAVYCVIMALYTIPAAYLISLTVNRHLKVGNQIL